MRLRRFFAAAISIAATVVAIAITGCGGPLSGDATEILVEYPDGGFELVPAGSAAYDGDITEGTVTITNLGRRMTGSLRLGLAADDGPEWNAGAFALSASVIPGILPGRAISFTVFPMEGFDEGFAFVTVSGVGISGELRIPVGISGLPRLEPAPTIRIDGDIVSWDSVPNAGGYILLMEGIERADIGMRTLSFNLAHLGFDEPGDHAVTLVARGLAGKNRNSAPSNEVVYTVDGPRPGLTPLPAPEISVADGSTWVRWTAIPNADGYSLRVNGSEWPGITIPAGATEWDLSLLDLPDNLYHITLIAIGREGVNLNSPPGNRVIFRFPKLATPETRLEGGILRWDAVPGAAGYSLGIGGAAVSLVEDWRTGFDLSVLELSPGTYPVSLKALGGRSFRDSDWSLARLHTVSAPQSGLEKLRPPVLTAHSGPVLTWDAVPGAGGYLLLMNGSPVSGTDIGRDQRTLNIAGLGFAPGTHAFTLVALGVDGRNLNSDPSNRVDVAITEALPALARLPAPAIGIEGSIVVWKPVDGAGGYSLRVGGTEMQGGSLAPAATGFDLARLPLAAGTYSVTLIAKGVDGTSLDSPHSNVEFYTVAEPQIGLEPLDRPTLRLVEMWLRWNPIEGAAAYSLSVNGTVVKGDIDANETSFDVSTLALPGGTHVATIVAVGDGHRENSQASNPVTIPVLGVGGTNVIVTLPEFLDMAAGISQIGPTFPMLDPNPWTITLYTERHDVTSVRWMIGGSEIDRQWIDESRPGESVLTLNPALYGTSEGTHHVTLEVAIGGLRYSRTIVFRTVLNQPN